MESRRTADDDTRRDRVDRRAGNPHGAALRLPGRGRGGRREGDMSALSPVLRSLSGGGVAFWCPGCDEAHVISPAIWTWDGNVEAPTFSPSVLVTCGHYVPGYEKERCWCTYNAEHHDYYAQFVTPAVLDVVRGAIGVERIRASADPHMNDIPLPLWDALESRIHGAMNTTAFHAAGETRSLGTAVCIAKTAARMLKE
jgi:hypothetical protein